jgi:hypothetical protein
VQLATDILSSRAGMKGQTQNFEERNIFVIVVPSALEVIMRNRVECPK